MRMVDLIKAKRDGKRHTRSELAYIVKGAAEQTLPDYQLSAWLMAVVWRGMTEEETADLTDLIAHSGEILDLSGVPGVKVDKHSTGGVGDKVTLVLAPLVASAGAVVAKLSGRGLGHTGGTIDKLEAIPGFETSLSTERFIQQLKDVQVAVAGQTKNLAPADGTLYALRDVTATVESIPLIAASVLSKKVAAGADVIVLDVKYGSGAFMKDVESARELARTLVRVGKHLGKSVIAVISCMCQPLGHAIGNALEVEESIETLKGQGPADLTALCLDLGAVMLKAAHLVPDEARGKQLLRDKIASGEALAKFRDMVQAQGGDPEMVDDPRRLPQARQTLEVLSPQAGYVTDLAALPVGLAVKLLGGGRDKKSDPIDLAVGVVLHKKYGDAVKAGESLATLHVNRMDQVEEAQQMIVSAYRIGPVPPEPVPMIEEIVLPHA